MANCSSARVMASSHAWKRRGVSRRSIRPVCIDFVHGVCISRVYWMTSWVQAIPGVWCLMSGVNRSSSMARGVFPILRRRRFLRSIDCGWTVSGILGAIVAWR